MVALEDTTDSDDLILIYRVESFAVPWQLSWGAILEPTSPYTNEVIMRIIQ